METKNADLSSLRIDRSNNEENNSSKKTIFIIIGVVLLIIVGYFVVTSFLGNSVEVKLTTAVLQKPGQTTASLTASGYVVAQRKAAIKRNWKTYLSWCCGR